MSSIIKILLVLVLLYVLYLNVGNMKYSMKDNQYVLKEGISNTSQSYTNVINDIKNDITLSTDNLIKENDTISSNLIKKFKMKKSILKNTSSTTGNILNKFLGSRFSSPVEQSTKAPELENFTDYAPDISNYNIASNTLVINEIEDKRIQKPKVTFSDKVSFDPKPNDDVFKFNENMIPNFSSQMTTIYDQKAPDTRLSSYFNSTDGRIDIANPDDWERGDTHQFRL
jgi:hypothetical protein